MIYVDGVDSGVYYKFRYRARNIHGDSEESETIILLAATEPSQMGRPSISI